VERADRHRRPITGHCAGPPFTTTLDSAVSIAARIVLISLAAILGGYVALTGASVSYGLEPYRFDRFTIAFYVAVGAVVSCPLWVAAFIPNRFPRLSQVWRFLGVLLMLYPMWLFGGLVIHHIGRIGARGFTPSVFLQGLILSTVCLLGVALLLWPEIRAVIKRRAT
jgi:hypothetical protein